MTDQHRSIPVDYQGKPITNGVPVRNNKEYVAKAGMMVILAHFLFHPFAVVYWTLVGLLALICFLPGGALLGSYSDGHIHGVGFEVVGIVLMVIGGLIWLRYTIRWTKRFVRWIAKHTKMRYVGSYRGPVAPVTDYLDREQARRRDWDRYSSAVAAGKVPVGQSMEEWLSRH